MTGTWPQLDAEWSGVQSSCGTGRIVGEGSAGGHPRRVGGAGRGLRAATHLVALVHERATGVGGEEEFDEVGLACGRGVRERRGG